MAGKWRGRGSRQRQRRSPPQAVLDELTSAGGLSARELSERLKVGSRTLERDLAVLREAGRVLREGPPKTSKRDMRCFGWETTTPVDRNEGECRRSKSRDARAKGSGTGASSPPRSPTGCWWPVTPQPDHNTPDESPQGDQPQGGQYDARARARATREARGCVATSGKVALPRGGDRE